MEPLNYKIPNHAVCIGCVFGEAVHNPAKRVEAHWGAGYPSKHRVVERIAQVHENGSDEEASGPRDHNSGQRNRNEENLVLSGVGLREERRPKKRLRHEDSP